jgi:hypothetical protein
VVVAPIPNASVIACHGGESGTAHQGPAGVTHIQRQIFEPARATLVTHVLLVALHSPKRDGGSAASLVRREAGVDVTLRLHLEMVAHLLVHRVLILLLTEQGADRCADLVIPRHLILRRRRSEAHG